mmetsp:Transcript_40659/g.95717  ORF Transcript_40659/g.95717 Transcript_40659/m.95717 type:complete len:225 (+) Transcript_40659:78-752(+)|eukprot:CAMPEP_0179861764 /NCGR_PEP_ID=MMETSP0982-20121206/14453_1 /TAXON_ID=483367 /ORGANISM="non described non described, Strain CCMP 2436" /LENGTH=224 /DNA_ID=CAMNT_0021749363 /DNA_START=82 /DNA_END=756 /DNA_ORIENTATION=+
MILDKCDQCLVYTHACAIGKGRRDDMESSTRTAVGLRLLFELGRHPGSNRLPDRIRLVLLDEVPTRTAVDGGEVWQGFLDPLCHLLVDSHPWTELEEELRHLRDLEPLGVAHHRLVVRGGLARERNLRRELGDRLAALDRRKRRFVRGDLLLGELSDDHVRKQLVEEDVARLDEQVPKRERADDGEYDARVERQVTEVERAHGGLHEGDAAHVSLVLVRVAEAD